MTNGFLAGRHDFSPSVNKHLRTVLALRRQPVDANSSLASCFDDSLLLETHFRTNILSSLDVDNLGRPDLFAGEVDSWFFNRLTMLPTADLLP